MMKRQVKELEKIKLDISKENKRFLFRGIVEGFYGDPWSYEQRKEMIKFISLYKMNSYLYAPKNDLYHRTKWRDNYPENELDSLISLINCCRDNGIKFIFSVSPGETICYCSETDFIKLYNKYEVFVKNGVKDIAILFDDVKSEFSFIEDKVHYGMELGRAQSEIANRLYDSFKEKYIESFSFCPTEYSGYDDTDYKKSIKKYLNPNILIYWTGKSVFPKTITKEDACKAIEVYGHEILLWDNFPVNDADPRNLVVAPLTGRAKDLCDFGIKGYIANPMIQPEVSKIPLITSAEYAWNPKGYNPQESLTKALLLYGIEKSDCLRLFAENSSYHRINPHNAKRLQYLIDQFINNGETVELLNYFEKMDNLYLEIKCIDNRFFQNDIREWLPKIQLTSKLGKCILDVFAGKERRDYESIIKDYKEVNKNFAGDYVLYLLAFVETQKLSLSEKIAQMVMIGINSTNVDIKFTKVILNNKIGNIFLNSDGCVDMEKTQGVLNDLSKDMNIPPFVAVEQEGGMNTKHKYLLNYMSNYELKETGNTFNTFYDAANCAKELTKIGINMNIGPVLNTSKFIYESEMGERAFSNDIKECIEYGQQSILGYQYNEISCVAKYLSGDVDITSRFGEVFIETAQMGLAGILTSYPINKLNSSNINNIREKYLYTGLIVTGDISIKENYDISSMIKDAIKAVMCGVDLIVFSKNINICEEFADKLYLAAMQEERIKKNIDLSTTRILFAKYKFL